MTENERSAAENEILGLLATIPEFWEHAHWVYRTPEAWDTITQLKDEGRIYAYRIGRTKRSADERA